MANELVLSLVGSISKNHIRNLTLSFDCLCLVIFYDENNMIICHTKICLHTMATPKLSSKIVLTGLIIDYHFGQTYHSLTLSLYPVKYYDERARTFANSIFDSIPIQYSTPKLRSKTPFHRIQSALRSSVESEGGKEDMRRF